MAEVVSLHFSAQEEVEHPTCEDHYKFDVDGAMVIFAGRNKVVVSTLGPYGGMWHGNERHELGGKQ